MKHGNIEFTAGCEYAIKNSDYIFIAVGIPLKEDDLADLSYVESAYRSIVKYIGDDDFKVIVNKSTVSVGTRRWIKEFVESLLEKRRIKNPEKDLKLFQILNS